MISEVFIVVNTKTAVFKNRGNRFVRNAGMAVYQTTRCYIL
jgi:hypothetical protein